MIHDYSKIDPLTAAGELTVVPGTPLQLQGFADEPISFPNDESFDWSTREMMPFWSVYKRVCGFWRDTYGEILRGKRISEIDWDTRRILEFSQRLGGRSAFRALCAQNRMPRLFWVSLRRCAHFYKPTPVPTKRPGQFKPEYEEIDPSKIKPHETMIPTIIKELDRVHTRLTALGVLDPEEKRGVHKKRQEERDAEERRVNEARKIGEAFCKYMEEGAKLRVAMAEIFERHEIMSSSQE